MKLMKKKRNKRNKKLFTKFKYEKRNFQCLRMKKKGKF